MSDNHSIIWKNTSGTGKDVLVVSEVGACLECSSYTEGGQGINGVVRTMNTVIKSELI